MAHDYAVDSIDCKLHFKCIEIRRLLISKPIILDQLVSHLVRPKYLLHTRGEIVAWFYYRWRLFTVPILFC